MAGIAAKGSAIWFYDPVGSSVVKIMCPQNFTLDPGTRSKTTEPPCLETGVSVGTAGNLEPGTSSLDLPFDPREVSHSLLWTKFKSGEELPFIFGFSDGENAPTFVANEWVLSDSRSWFEFKGFFSNVPITADPESKVQSSISIELTTVPELVEAGVGGTD